MSDNSPSPTNLTVVGLDLSLTGTGVALLGGETPRTRTIRSKGTAGDGLLTRGRRLRRLADEVTAWASLGDIVIIEQPAYGQTGAHLEAKDIDASLARALIELDRVEEANASKPKCMLCGQPVNRLDGFGLCSKITAAHERRRAPGGTR